MHNAKQVALESYAYKALVGSRAYGLNSPDSDYDYRGFFILPSWMYWKPSIIIPEQVEAEQDDTQFWEFDKYIKLLMQANPNVLETLWSSESVIAGGPTFKWVRMLIDNRHIFLTRNIEKTYGGYSVSQLARGQRYIDDGKIAAGWKHLMHLLRLLISVNHALRKHDLLVNMGDYRDDLLSVRNGKWTMDQFSKWHQELESEFNSLKETTSLPETVDMDVVDAIAVGMRKAMT